MREHCPRSVGADSSRLGARPHRQQALSRSSARYCPPINVARNSHAISSNVESTSLELQRFRVILKSDRGKLRAKFVWRLSGRRSRVPCLGPCLEASPCSPTLRPLPLGAFRADDGGFCSIRSLPSACRRRVAPLLVQFPPFGGGVVAVRGDVAPNVQTTSAKNADNGQSWARSSALAAQRRLASRVARTFTPEM